MRTDSCMKLDQSLMTSYRYFATLTIAFGLAGSNVLLGASDVGAAQATASAGATIQGSGSVGAVTTTTSTTTTTTTAAATTANQTATTSTSIRTIAVSATSNLGYEASAPAAAATTTSSSTSGNTQQSTARRFSNTRVATLPVGPSAAVAVAGAPNQTYAVILPQQTVFASATSLVSLSDFEHSAGLTPSLDASGSDVFSIGAATESKSLGAANAASGNAQPNAQDSAGGADGSNPQGRGAVLAQAFAPSAPFVNIVVSYN